MQLHFFTLTCFAVAASALTTPIRRDDSVSTFGPFQLFAQGGDSESYQVRLVDMGAESISTMTVCETWSCGWQPDSWYLDDGVLSANMNTNLLGAPVTINMPVQSGKVNFVSGQGRFLTMSSDYSAVNATDNSSDMLLSVNGSADKFSICSFIGVPGPAHRQDIYYNQTSNAIANHCRATNLVAKAL